MKTGSGVKLRCNFTPLPENLKIGETRRYHEEGNVGNVQILEIDHHYKIGNSDYTRIKVRALEELSGSRLVKPFPAGNDIDGQLRKSNS